MKERTVTGPDEDPITLGAESARRCLKQAGIRPETVDGLIFASETNPYVTKSAATVLQDILGLKKESFVTDVQSSHRGGFDAIRIAKSLVDSGACHQVLIIAPGHVYEYAAAAGSASLLIGTEGVIAEIDDLRFASEDKPNWYRLAGDRYLQLGAGFVGYISNWGLMDSLKLSWAEYVKQNNVAADQYEFIALPQGTIVQSFMSSAAIGCDPYSALPYTLSEMTGDMGCAAVLISLCSILDLIDEAGKKVLACCYGWGDGSAIMGLTTSDLVGGIPNRPVVMPLIENKEMIPYAKVLKYEKKIDRNSKGLSSYY
jgi:3-hydroxy-3-methylglutaryl CoA synthase